MCNLNSGTQSLEACHTPPPTPPNRRSHRVGPPVRIYRRPRPHRDECSPDPHLAGHPQPPLGWTPPNPHRTGRPTPPGRTPPSRTDCRLRPCGAVTWRSVCIVSGARTFLRTTCPRQSSSAHGCINTHQRARCVHNIHREPMCAQGLSDSLLWLCTSQTTPVILMYSLPRSYQHPAQHTQRGSTIHLAKGRTPHNCWASN